mgnify:CR=1 FL=1
MKKYLLITSIDRVITRFSGVIHFGSLLVDSKGLNSRVLSLLVIRVLGQRWESGHLEVDGDPQAICFACEFGLWKFF